MNEANPRLHVVQFSAAFPLSGEAKAGVRGVPQMPLGGVALHVHNLAHGLVHTSRFRVDIVCGFSPETDEPIPPRLSLKRTLELDAGGIRVYRIPYFATHCYHPRRVIGEEIINYLIEGWRDAELDLIHAHDFDSAYLGAVAARALNVPLVVTIHRAVIPAQDGTAQNAKEAFIRLLGKGRLARGLVVPSRASQRVLSDRGVPSELIEVIPHGINFKHLIDQHAELDFEALGLQSDDTLYLCPVRADEHKDPTVVVRAAAALKKLRAGDPSSFPGRVCFLITADKGDDLYASLVASAAGLGLEIGSDIIFRTFPSKLMPALYRRAELCIVPSRDESFGQSVLEAFAFRCPVLAANSGGLSEVVEHEVSGIHFRDQKELLEGLGRLHTVPELRQKLVENGLRKLTSQFSSTTMIDRYERYYRRHIGATGKNSRRGRG